MLSLEQIVNNVDAVRTGLKRRGEDPPLDEVQALDGKRRELIHEAETIRAKRNEVSRAIGREKRPPTDEEKSEMRLAGSRIGEIEADLGLVQGIAWTKFSYLFPNLPLESVPDGLDESANVLVSSGQRSRNSTLRQSPSGNWARSWGSSTWKPARESPAPASTSLRARGHGCTAPWHAWLLDTLTEEFGYTEIEPPLLVRPDTMTGSGNLPKFKDNLYRDEETDLWLVPTAEVGLNALHQGQIIDPHVLPLKYVAWTPCFRKEHTAAGRDVRGIKRLHQFEKVETFRFVEPEDSDQALEEMLEHATTLCERLGLSHRVVALCAGDLGFQSAKTYDIEVWAPGSEEWLEVSSISTCTDFQARRNNTRYRPERGARTRFPHTLNGSAFGMPRMLIAVLENGVRADGSVEIPEPVRAYTGFDRIP